MTRRWPINRWLSGVLMTTTQRWVQPQRCGPFTTCTTLAIATTRWHDTALADQPVVVRRVDDHHAGKDTAASVQAVNDLPKAQASRRDEFLGTVRACASGICPPRRWFSEEFAPAGRLMVGKPFTTCTTLCIATTRWHSTALADQPVVVRRVDDHHTEVGTATKVRAVTAKAGREFPPHLMPLRGAPGCARHSGSVREWAGNKNTDF